MRDNRPTSAFIAYFVLIGRPIITKTEINMINLS